MYARIHPQTQGPLAPRAVLHMTALDATDSNVIEAEEKKEGAQ